MKDDMTYNEVDFIKSDIKMFVDHLIEFGEQHSVLFSQADISFFSLISKHIIFFKYMYQPNQLGRFYKVLISDGYYFIISIIKRETRYIYVNERSIIENYLRIMINKTIEEDHITENIFRLVKEQYSAILTDKDFSLLKTEYITSCEYIHGGNIMDESLSWVFDECVQNNRNFKDINKYYIRIQRILKIFDSMIMHIYKEEVNGAFHRRKSVLEYLLGKECVDILFLP